MTLSEYVLSFPRNQRAAIRYQLAKGLSVSEVFIRSMCNGNKAIPAKYAIRIENLTSGLVSRHITAPEFYPINQEDDLIDSARNYVTHLSKAF